MGPELSVIVPALNEAAALPALLGQLQGQQAVRLEILVADGGSTDATPRLAEAAGARVVHAPKGRATQMNAAARQATAPLLLFLHADSAFTAPNQLRAAMDQLGAAGPTAAGHFPLHFLRARPGRELFYRYLQAKTALARPGTINGDQGLMLSADWFGALGGFDERLPFLEDQRLAEQVFARGEWVTFDLALATSARRFESEGPARRYTLMALIMGLHAAQAHEWFAAAPKVYPSQDETGVLDVGAYLRLTWRVLIEAGPRRAAEILWRASRHARQNAWQAAFWIDVARGAPERRVALRFFDRRIAPLLDNAVADAVATLLVSAWFLVVLPAAYFVADRIVRAP